MVKIKWIESYQVFEKSRNCAKSIGKLIKIKIKGKEPENSISLSSIIVIKQNN
jgi:hypothetical protein